MTRKRVTDEEYGNLSRKLSELCRRVDEGTLPFEATMEGLQRLIEGQGEIFLVTVDFSMTLVAMIAAGHYDWVNSNITQDHFLITGSGTVELELELIQFKNPMSTDNVLKELDRQGYRPATLPELLAFGAKYPEKQREFPIIAIGSVLLHSDGDRCVPCLGEGSLKKRRLGLDWHGRAWGGNCRFLAVRK